MTLFNGRKDVHAKRWQNKQGKSGYSPVCANEWVKGICVLREICNEKKIPFAVERSRSGNGAHIWFFFMERITKEEIDFYTSEFCVGNELGDLKETDDESIKTWEKNKENYKFSKADFPDIVQITIANMIFISKEGFSNKALDFIKRMAAFKNPEFYKAQAMRLSTFDKARIISLSYETVEYLCVPRGCEDDLCSFLTENKIDFRWDDRTYIGKPIRVEFNGQLREEQIVAVDAMLKYDNGVLSATMQSLVKKGEVKELVKDYGMIIVDECHHVSAFSFEQILKNVVAKYVYGLTERTAHVKLLSDALKEKIANVITLTGGMSKKERKSQNEKLSGVPKVDSMVIVATGKFIGEGFDEPRLDALFLAMPISWKGTLQQYAGRLNRLYENKNEVQIYNYIDVHVGILERMYQKRLSGYAQIGYSAKTDSTPLETINSIYNNDNFFTVFSNDILLAKNDVVIVNQFLLIKTKFFNIIELLANVSKNGITVNIFTSAETGFRV